MTDTRIAGSFRDPAGKVHIIDDRIFRTVTEFGYDDFKAVLDTGYLDRLVDKKWLVPFEAVTETKILKKLGPAKLVLEHPRLRYISFPYEWSFTLLKTAALRHLDIVLDALDHDVVLTDATAYNIQFDGPRPIMIDHLSFRPYRPGEYWLAHRQFCEQFLNPLLLRADFGITHNAWYRGEPDGIPTSDIAQLYSGLSRFSFKKQAHIFLPARFQQNAKAERERAAKQLEQKPLSKAAYRGLVSQLRSWISKLSPKGGLSVWEDYDNDNSYRDDEARQKAEYISQFCAQVKPDLLFDLGCNSGAFSEAGLSGGAKSAIGFDFDQGALEKGFQRAERLDKPFLPLFLDATNPSPDLGWQQIERQGFAGRAQADAVIALAFIHHLAIAKNINLDSLIDWIMAQAPAGIIEFVDKNDPMIQDMLKLREDIFSGYTREAFENAIKKRGKIVDQKTVSVHGRTLYHFQK